MRFKLDENLGLRTQLIFQEAGHDVQTVREELLSGTSDEVLFKTCQEESRCLVTLDLDFSNILRFSPKNTAGIVVYRLQRNPTLTDLELLTKQLLNALKSISVENNLWIVEIGRLRLHD